MLDPVKIIKFSKTTFFILYHFGLEPNKSKTLREILSCKPLISIAFAIANPPKNKPIISWKYTLEIAFDEAIFNIGNRNIGSREVAPIGKHSSSIIKI